jgi:hypothetical protein
MHVIWRAHGRLLFLYKSEVLANLHREAMLETLIEDLLSRPTAQLAVAPTRSGDDFSFLEAGDDAK